YLECLNCYVSTISFIKRWVCAANLQIRDFSKTRFDTSKSTNTRNLQIREIYKYEKSTNTRFDTSKSTNTRNLQIQEIYKYEKSTNT
ncbi:hypothetical protein L9F63_013054, partial [Diploptera punctata]